MRPADGTTSTTAPGVSAVRRWVLLATMLLGTILAGLDSSILTLSVVPVMEEFRADLATVPRRLVPSAQPTAPRAR